MKTHSQISYSSFTSSTIPTLFSSVKNHYTFYDRKQLQTRYSLKQTNDFHNYLRNCRFLNKNKLGNFHHSCLKEKYTQYVQSKRPKIFVTDSNITPHKHSIPSITSRADYSSSLSPSHRVLNTDGALTRGYFDTKHNFINQHSIKNFISNTRNFQKKKFLSLCHREKLRTYKEDLEKNEESVQRFKYSIDKNKELLDDMMKSLTQYVKFLDIKAEKLKVKNVSLLSRRHELELCNNKLRQEINKLENTIEEYKEYKIFLIKVKFRVKDVKDLPLHERVKYGMISNLELLELIHKQNPKKNTTIVGPVKRNSIRTWTRKSLNRTSFIELTSRRRSRANTLTSKNNQLLQSNKDGIPTNIPIFDSLEEFIESWQKIDKKTFSYFSTFNKNHYTVFNLNKTKQELTETYNQTKQNTKTYKTFLNQELNKLKVKQNQLKTTLFQLRTKLLKADIKRNLFIKLKKMILSFPIDIANIINDDKVYSNINSTTEFILISGVKVNSITYAVSVLEKLIFNFYFEINTFKSKGMNNLQQYNEWKLTIDRHNRERKNKQNKLIQLQNRKIMNEKIIAKINKVNYKPRRIINHTPTCIITKIRKKVKQKEIANEEIMDNETLLTY